MSHSRASSPIPQHELSGSQVVCRVVPVQALFRPKTTDRLAYAPVLRPGQIASHFFKAMGQACTCSGLADDLKICTPQGGKGRSMVAEGLRRSCYAQMDIKNSGSARWQLKTAICLWLEQPAECTLEAVGPLRMTCRPLAAIFQFQLTARCERIQLNMQPCFSFGEWPERAKRRRC